MSEIINTYLLDDFETSLPMNRDAFYVEQIRSFEKSGKPSRAADIIAIFIFNRAGELLIQKRSYTKNHNPGLLDKSIGGHIRYGDTPDFTVMVEAVQELQTPSIVLKDIADFDKALQLLREYLHTIAVVYHVKTKLFTFEQIIQKEKIIVANKVHMYFGIYDGSIRPVDGEAKGVLWYSLPELAQEMDTVPQTFSHAMHVYMNELHGEMEKFLAFVR